MLFNAGRFRPYSLFGFIYHYLHAKLSLRTFVVEVNYVLRTGQTRAVYEVVCKGEGGGTSIRVARGRGAHLRCLIAFGISRVIHFWFLLL